MKRLSPRRVLLLLLLAVLLAAAAVWLVPRLGTAVVFLRSITPEDILAILPQNQVLAVLLLLGLFLVKSCTVFFPISALRPRDDDREHCREAPATQGISAVLF